MSNYPPGVTGSEPQITGASTCDCEECSCTNIGLNDNDDGTSICDECGMGLHEDTRSDE